MANKMCSNLEQIDSDLKSFLEFCKENHLTNQEISKICEPLISPIERTKLKRNIWYLALLLSVMALIYYVILFETISWHMSAVGRIILIKLLPFWNWQYLKNEKCFIPSFISKTLDNNPSYNCVLCESINKIYIETNIDPDILNEHYLELHKPVIILDSLNNWPIYNNPELDVINDEIVLASTPCNLMTNVYNGMANVAKLLQRAKEFDEFFIHFQNCDFNTVKAFRTISPKPSFFPAEISPVQYSWLLISKNYNMTVFKPIELIERITVIAQVKGSYIFRLTPRLNCIEECPILDIQLQRGETLVLTSIWNLEYKSIPEKKNIAIILEMH